VDYDDEVLTQIWVDANQLSRLHPIAGKEMRIEFEERIEYNDKRFLAHVKALEASLEVEDTPSKIVTPYTGRSRGAKLFGAAAANQEARERVASLKGDSESGLELRYRCIDTRCINHPNYCFKDYSGLHYDISEADMRMWAGKIACGDASMENPPHNLYQRWFEVNGPVGEGGLRTKKKTNETEKKDSFDRFSATMEKMMDMQDRQAEFQLQSQMLRMRSQMPAMMSSLMPAMEPAAFPAPPQVQPIVEQPPASPPQHPEPLNNRSRLHRRVHNRHLIRCKSHSVTLAQYDPAMRRLR
jgi:hypothetical protein